MNFITKVKETLAWTSLMLGTGIVSLSETAAQPEAASLIAAEKTDMSDAERSQMLLKGLRRDKNGWRGTVLFTSSEEELRQKAQQYLKERKNPSVYDCINTLPALYRDIVRNNEAHFYIDTVCAMCFLFYSDMLRVILNHDEMFVTPLSFRAVNEWLTQPQRGIHNSMRHGKPFVSLSSSQLNRLTETEQRYIVALHEVLNENIHYLGNTPLPDWKRFCHMLGGALLAPTLVRPETFYENNGPAQQDMNKTHAELVDLFAAGNEVKYQIQDRLGTPFYNPQTVCPDLTWPKLSAYREDSEKYGCMGWGYCNASPLGIPLLISHLRPNGGTRKYYHVYYDELNKSMALLRDGLKAELEQIKPTSLLYAVVKGFESQTNQYLKTMERTVDKIHRGKLKNVWTLLDPAGEYKSDKLETSDRKTKNRDKRKERKSGGAGVSYSSSFRGQSEFPAGKQGSPIVIGRRSFCLDACSA